MNLIAEKGESDAEVFCDIIGIRFAGFGKWSFVAAAEESERLKRDTAGWILAVLAFYEVHDEFFAYKKAAYKPLFYMREWGRVMTSVRSAGSLFSPRREAEVRLSLPYF